MNPVKFTANNKNWKRSVLFDTLLSLFIFSAYVLCALLSLIWKFEVGLLLYFLATVYLLSNREKFGLSLIILALPLLLQLFYTVSKIKLTLYSLPASIAPFVGILGALLFFRNNRAVKTAILLLIISLGAWFALSGRDVWRAYTKYDTPDYSVEEQLPDISFRSPDSTLVPASSISGKVQVFDLWTINCGPCFKAFPEWSAWMNDYKENDQVKFLAVNLPNTDQSFTDVRRVLSKYVSVPINPVIPDNTGQAFFQTELKVTTVPTTVIVVNKVAIFRGDMEEGKQVLKSILKNQ